MRDDKFWIGIAGALLSVAAALVVTAVLIGLGVVL